MKLLLLALSVMLLFIAGQALDCHRCVPKAADEDCELTVETCKPEKDACAATKFLMAPYGRYQKCMAMSDCEMLKINSFIQIKCCNSDLCNTADD
ncbi:CD59B glycoprotein [Vanacampus margaritifer]